MKERWIILRGDDIFRMFQDYLGNELVPDAKFGGFLFNSTTKQLALVYNSLDSSAKDLEAKCDLRIVSSVRGNT